MTSKRCYKEAYNPVSVVARIVRRYSETDQETRYLLHSFVKAIGIFPAGSVIQLLNRQLVYVLDSEGPLVVPFTDSSQRPLSGVLTPIDLSDEEAKTGQMIVDTETPLIAPIDAYHLLPDNLRQLVVK